MDYEKKKMERMYSGEEGEKAEGSKDGGRLSKYDLDFIDKHLDTDDLESDSQALQKKIQKDFHPNFLHKVLNFELPTSDLQLLFSRLY